jgi:hypothetical protein
VILKFGGAGVQAGSATGPSFPANSTAYRESMIYYPDNEYSKIRGILKAAA